MYTWKTWTKASALALGLGAIVALASAPAAQADAGAAQTPPRSQCCFPAPSVIEFDKQGNMLQAWGGPGSVPDWPATEHGLWVDKQGFVWLAGNGGGDRMLLKFTNNGTLVAQ